MTRKHKPTAAKILSGTAAHNPQRINKREPEAPAGPLIPPDDLDHHGRKEWARIVKAMRDMNTESPVYHSALVPLVHAYSDYMTCRERALKSGLAIVEKDELGRVKVSRNQFAVEMRAAREMYVKMLTEFGLTPSSKARISTEKGGNDLDAKYFGVIG